MACRTWLLGRYGGPDSSLYGVVHRPGPKDWNEWTWALYESRGNGPDSLIRASGRAGSEAAARKRVREVAPSYGDGRLKGSWRCLWPEGR